MSHRKAKVSGTFTVRFSDVDVSLSSRFNLEDDSTLSDDELHDALQDPSNMEQILNLGRSEFELDEAKWTEDDNVLEPAGE